MRKVSVLNAIGTNYGRADYKVSLLNLVANGSPKNIVQGKTSIADLVYLDRNIPKKSKAKVQMADLIPDNSPREEQGLIVPRENSPKLICDNPQCRLPIYEDPVAFSPQYKEVYHPTFGCINQAMAIKAFDSAEIVFSDIDYIPRFEAVKIKSGLARKLHLVRCEDNPDIYRYE